ncbi:MAG: hypothetical protein WC861_05440 [Candidatus Micrarchaeia archaeon]|jgi:hypothetical protein
MGGLIKGVIPVSMLVAILLLLAGCTGSQPNNPQAPAAQPSGPNPQPTAPNPGPAAAPGCPLQYEGTYKGVMADSGDLDVNRPDSKGNYHSTQNPFTASYDFEMTLKCGAQFKDDATGVVIAYIFNITHVKASHPLFDCADGCTPITSKLGEGSFVYIANNGSGSMTLTFPNGMYGIADVSGLQASPDGKTIDVFIAGNTQIGETIGHGADSQGNYVFVETYNCEHYGGEGWCGLRTLLPNTITLTKVS